MQLPIKKALSKEYKRACARASPVAHLAPALHLAAAMNKTKSFAGIELEL